MNKKIFFLSMMLLGGSSVHALAAPIDVATATNPTAAIEVELAGLTGQARVDALNNLILSIARLQNVTPAAKAAAVSAALASYPTGIAPPDEVAAAAAAVAQDSSEDTSETPASSN